MNRQPRSIHVKLEGWCRWVLFVAVAITLVGCRQDPLAGPLQQVKIGMPKDEAVAVLQREAWYHQPCVRGDLTDDLFFFGSHAWDRASALILTSKRNGQEFRVTDVSSFEDANAWHTAYADCLQREKFVP